MWKKGTFTWCVWTANQVQCCAPKHLTQCSHKTLCVQVTPLLHYSVGFSTGSWLLFYPVFTDKQLMSHVVVILTKLHYRLRSIFVFWAHCAPHEHRRSGRLQFILISLLFFYQQHSETDWNGHIVSSSLYLCAQLNNLVKSVMVKIRAWTNLFYLFFSKATVWPFLPLIGLRKVSHSCTEAWLDKVKTVSYVLFFYSPVWRLNF